MEVAIGSTSQPPFRTILSSSALHDRETQSGHSEAGEEKLEEQSGQQAGPVILAMPGGEELSHRPTPKPQGNVCSRSQSLSLWGLDCQD